MTAPFEARIQRSLSDPALQAALDGNAERRLKARTAAFTSLPDDLQVFRHALALPARRLQARQQVVSELMQEHVAGNGPLSQSELGGQRLLNPSEGLGVILIPTCRSRTPDSSQARSAAGACPPCTQ